jgi:asparagine synthase (glutamine-hydrolysing)
VSSTPPPTAHAGLRHWTEQPFFHAKRVGREVRTRGSATCLLGRRGACQPSGEPDGIFAEWEWNGETLTVRNDRYGYQPLFYARSGDEVWVSPSIPKLIAEGAPAELDDSALAVFLRMGTFVGDDTPFAAIRHVPPGARFTWREGHLDVGGQYLIARPRSLSRDAAVDGYVELFRIAIRRQATDPERIVVPLTGGRDSRHILLELCESGVRPRRCATTAAYPPGGDEDVTVAARVAAAVGVEHQVIAQPRSRYQAERRKNELTSLCTVEHAWVLPLADDLQGGGYTVYDGIAGDTLSQSQLFTTQRIEWYEQGKLAALAEDLLGAEGYLPRLLPAGLYQRVARPVGLERLRAELARHVEAPNPFSSFRFYNRTRRTVSLAPHGILAQVADVRAPYLDHELYDFLSSLPAALTVDRRFHTDAIARAYPRYADIPYEVKGARAAGSQRAHYHRLGAEVLRAAARPTRERFLLRTPLVARVMRAMVSPRCLSEVVSLGVLATYLFQIEEAASNGPAR